MMLVLIIFEALNIGQKKHRTINLTEKQLMSSVNGFVFKREISDLSVVKNLQLLTTYLHYKIYYSSYKYILDANNQRLVEFDTDKELNDMKVIEEVAQWYEFLYKAKENKKESI